jgi:branched-subunit amino acid ABC-type transport system permease component
MQHVVLPLVIGIAEGLVLALIALGLVLTYGMMRIVNMAHGAFLMLSAFLIAVLLGHAWSRSVPGYVLAALIAIVIPTAIGMGLERTVYRRLYGRAHGSAFLAMFALMMVFQGAAQQIWGVSPLPVKVPSSLITGYVKFLDVQLPDYYLMTIVIGVLAIAITAAIVYRTKVGLWTRAIAADREMSAVLGAKVQLTFGLMFGLGSALAALAGILLAPINQVTISLGTDFILEAFAVVLIGGLGSMTGAVIAALVIGIVQSFLTIDYPPLSGYGIYLVMVIVLVFRPSGLFKTANAGLGAESV